MLGCSGKTCVGRSGQVETWGQVHSWRGALKWSPGVLLPKRPAKYPKKNAKKFKTKHSALIYFPIESKIMKERMATKDTLKLRKPCF